MMRDIKFRIWDKYAKEFQYIDAVDDFKFWISGYQDPPSKKLSELGLQQYTGLLDKNGREIFDGDIICNGIHSSPVVWGDGGWGIKVKESGIFPMPLTVPEVYEVIGNVHENPELLKHDQKI